MARTYMKLAVSRICGTPEEGKWTKTLPALEWIVRANMICGMLGRLITRAGEALNVVPKKQPAVAAPAAPTTEAAPTRREPTWHEIAGVRFEQAKRATNCENTVAMTLIMVLLMERVKPIVICFLSASSADR